MIVIVRREAAGGAGGRDGLYETAVREFGRALDRLAAGYEADPEKRLDLRQDIHFQLWRSFEVFDGRRSLKTWTFRVAHNTAVSYVSRELRKNAGLVSLEEIERTASSEDREPDIDQQRALEQLSGFHPPAQTAGPADHDFVPGGDGYGRHRGNHRAFRGQRGDEDSPHQEHPGGPLWGGETLCPIEE